MTFNHSRDKKIDEREGEQEREGERKDQRKEREQERERRERARESERESMQCEHPLHFPQASDRAELLDKSLSQGRAGRGGAL